MLIRLYRENLVLEGKLHWHMHTHLTLKTRAYLVLVHTCSACANTSACYLWNTEKKCHLLNLWSSYNYGKILKPAQEQVAQRKRKTSIFAHVLAPALAFTFFSHQSYISGHLGWFFVRTSTVCLLPLSCSISSVIKECGHGFTSNSRESDHKKMFKWIAV